MHAFTGSCEKFSFLKYDSWSALSWKYEPEKNRIRTFLKTPVVFSGFSLLSLEYSSPAVFAGVQDVLALVFHVSIKWAWGAALLVHHFVVRQRLIESQAFNLGQKVLRILLSHTQETHPTYLEPWWPLSPPLPGQCCLVGSKNVRATLQHYFFGGRGEYLEWTGL